MKTLAITAWIMIISGLLGTTNPKNTLRGVVTDYENGNPLNRATVVVFEQKKQVAITTTSRNGTFAFNLSTGSYTVEVSVKGYKTESLNVFIDPSKETVVNVSLKKELLIEYDLEEYEILTEQNFPRKAHERHMMAIGMPTTSTLFVSNDYDYIQHNTEEYDFINENRFRDALSNPLSTFSVDVDKASYANVRRFLNQNQKPYKDAVRIEELINYFDYDYPQPTNGDPFSVTIEVDKCPWNDNNQLVMIGLKGENINETEIPPNNLVFLIDVSGSMSPANRLPLLKQAFKYLVDQLRPQDRVAIVVYASATGMVLEPTSGSEKAKINAAIDRLEARGSTAGGAGIQLAYKIAKQNYIHGGNNRVILGTDGDFNVGISSTSELVRFLEEKRDDGIYLSILGFGMGNYKDGRMKQLSMAGNGNYAYIDNIMEAKKVFGTELWGTLYTIANDVKIQVEFNPAQVKSYRLIGYENRIMNSEDFNDDKKDAGDIGCGHTVTALYEIVPNKGDVGPPNVDPLKYTTQSLTKSKDLMTVKIRYKNPGEDTSHLITHSIEANKLKSTKNLVFASAVAEFGMLLRDSEFKGESSFKNAISRASEAKGSDEFGYRTEFVRMVQMAQMLYK